MDLQPEDQIREQCMILDDKTLFRFMLTNKKIYNACRNILDDRKQEYNRQKAELLQFFEVKPGILSNTFLAKVNDNKPWIVISGIDGFPDVISIQIPNDDSTLSEFLNKIQTKVHLGRYNYYNIHKSLLSDKLKLEFLALAKKSGYTEVNKFSTKGIEIVKSLNDFYILD